MLPLFTMPPPNELLNENDISLDEIRYPPDPENPAHHHYIIYPFPYSGEALIPPKLWDGRLLTLLCFEYNPLIEALHVAQHNSFPLKSWNSIAAKLRELFHDVYIAQHRECREWWHSIMHAEADAERLNKLYTPLTVDEVAAAKRGFDKSLQIVVQWAMCSYSRWKENWSSPQSVVAEYEKTHPTDATVPEVMATQLGDEDFVLNFGGNTKAKRVKGTHIETAAEKAERKRLALIRRKVAALRREGKIVEAALDMLDEGAAWESDYVN